MDINALLDHHNVSRQQVDLFAEEDLRDLINGTSIRIWYPVYVAMTDFMVTVTNAVWNQDCFKYSRIANNLQHMEYVLQQLSSYDRHLLGSGTDAELVEQPF